MYEGLDDITWRWLDSGVGTAEDVPRILRALAGLEPNTLLDSADDLAAALRPDAHVYEATVLAVPFLLELAGHAGAERRTRLRVLELLESLARCEDDFGEPEEELGRDPVLDLRRHRVAGAVRAGTASLQRIAQHDADLEIRHAAGEILG